VISERFGDIFYSNATKAGLLPARVARRGGRPPGCGGGRSHGRGHRGPHRPAGAPDPVRGR
jgi:hypothetical protein